MNTFSKEQKLITKEQEFQNQYLRIYLGASKGKEGFYERFGFIKRIDANLGYEMILNK